MWIQTIKCNSSASCLVNFAHTIILIIAIFNIWLLAVSSSAGLAGSSTLSMQSRANIINHWAGIWYILYKKQVRDVISMIPDRCTMSAGICNIHGTWQMHYVSWDMSYDTWQMSYPGCEMWVANWLELIPGERCTN